MIEGNTAWILTSTALVLFMTFSLFSFLTICDMCGGSRTPPGVRTIQQSLGAVVRAIPGVKRIEFDLNFQ